MICANCKEREGTVKWGDLLSVTHGFAQMWCEVCALTEQIKHAEERAALLPELRSRLDALLADVRSVCETLPGKIAAGNVEGAMTEIEWLAGRSDGK